MEYTELTFTMGRTINAGNYESVRVDVSGSVRLAEGEDKDAAMASMQTWVKEQLTKAITLTAQGGRRAERS